MYVAFTLGALRTHSIEFDAWKLVTFGAPILIFYQLQNNLVIKEGLGPAFWLPVTYVGVEWLIRILYMCLKQILHMLGAILRRSLSGFSELQKRVVLKLAPNLPWNMSCELAHQGNTDISGPGVFMSLRSI